MTTKVSYLVCFLALLLCFAGPAVADPVTLFTDLGPPGDVYMSNYGTTVCGLGFGSYCKDAKSVFSIPANGQFNVSQIDLGVSWESGPRTVFAALWTEDGFLNPGEELGFWNNLFVDQVFGGCCKLITISGISGVTLNGGQRYLMIVGPVDPNNTTFAAWNMNNQTNWRQGNPNAFDVLGWQIPEPGTLLSLCTGLILSLGAMRRKLS